MSTAVLIHAVDLLLMSTLMYRGLPFVDWQPRGLPKIHWVIGVVAFASCIPVAFYCLYDFGFQVDWGQPRVTLHSLAGCAFFGAFILKVTLVRTRGLRSWMLPLAGGVLATLTVVLWSISALWCLNGPPRTSRVTWSC